MKKEKIIIVFETTDEENKIDGFPKTWVRCFYSVKQAKKGIRDMERNRWRVDKMYKGTNYKF